MVCKSSETGKPILNPLLRVPKRRRREANADEQKTLQNAGSNPNPRIRVDRFRFAFPICSAIHLSQWALPFHRDRVR